MWTLRTVFLLAFLTMVSCQRRFPRQTNDLSTSEKFLNDVHVVAHDLTDSVALKKKAMVDAGTAVYKAKVGVLRDLKSLTNSNDAVNTLIDIKLAKLEAIRGMKLILLQTLANQIMTLMDQIENQDVTDLLESPVVNLVGEMLLPLLTGKNTITNYFTPVTHPSEESPSTVQNLFSLSTPSSSKRFVDGVPKS